MDLAPRGMHSPVNGGRFVIVGSGMQGTAVAYDLVALSRASRVVLADYDLARAEASAHRVTQLTGRTACVGEQVDASDPDAVASLLRQGTDVAISCTPYRLHASVEEGAFRAGVSVVDMGNDTEATLGLLARNEEAQSKNMTVVPDTGLAPGLVNSLGTLFLDRLHEVDSIRLFCGGLPQHPKPPFHYSLRFSIEGLVGEYMDEAIAIRNGQVVRLETLTEREELEVPGLGRMEAFHTSSGTSTAPFTYAGKIQTYEYKTLRYPGHCQLMRMLYDCGFWGDTPVQAGGVEVRPIDLFYALVGPKLMDPDDRDLVVVHAIAEGRVGGKPVRMQADILDYQDDVTGFSAMERMTGFCTAIVAAAVAEGKVRVGCVPYELALPGQYLVDELAKRGIVTQFS